MENENISGKKWIVIASISGFLAVAIGAFGAHGLSDSFSSGMYEVFKTGVLYHLIHSMVLLAIGLSGKDKFGTPAVFFLTGIVLFSFSLYVYSLTEVKFFVYITPFGGVSFLTGWAMTAIFAIKKK